MRHLSFAFSSFVALLSLVGCGPSNDVFVTWTIGGFAPKDVCEMLDNGEVKVTADSSDVRGGAVTTTTTTAKCTDAEAIVKAASFASISFDLVEGDTTFGVAGPVDIVPSIGEGSADDPVRVDIRPTQSHLEAHLSVVEEDCETAGVSDFSVSLFRDTGDQVREAVVTDEAVSCSGGDAVFRYAPISVGANYFVVARSGDDAYATDDVGEGVVPELLKTVLHVDLDATAP